MRIEFTLKVADSIPLEDLTQLFENASSADVAAQITDTFGCDGLIIQALGEESDLLDFLENYGMTLDHVEIFLVNIPRGMGYNKSINKQGDEL